MQRIFRRSSAIARPVHRLSTLNTPPTGKNKNTLLWLAGVGVSVLGAAYASVPLYRMFCQKTGYGGAPKTEKVDYKEKAKPVASRPLTIRFNADVAGSLGWTFHPCQKQMKVVVGEAALAFYKAHNLTDTAITGVSTYTVQPEAAAQYFNKIQCFCFEEQRVQPHEAIDMPVLFFIDKDFLTDAALTQTETVTLSYTFFKAGEADQSFIEEAALAEAKKKANMVLPSSSVAAGHVITQCNTGRMPDGSAAVVLK